MHARPHLLIFAAASFICAAPSSQANAAPKARARRAAPIYDLKPHKFSGKLTSRATIRAAAVECLQNHLAHDKGGGRNVAEVNGVHATSVRLSSVRVFPQRYAFNTVTRLGPRQVRFEARYHVLMGRDLQPAKLYLRSEMEIGKKAPKWGPRTRSPEYGDGVRSLPFHKVDPTTQTRID